MFFIRFSIALALVVQFGLAPPSYSEVHRVPVDGATLHVEIDGPEDAPPVLTWNGGGCTTRMWDKVVPRLTDRFRVIRFDARGVGQSTPSESEDLYTLDQYGLDVIAILNYFGYEKSIVWSMAWGSRGALVYAGLHPERVELLALYDASVGRAEVADQRAGNAKALEARIAAGDPIFEPPEGWNTHLSRDTQRKASSAAGKYTNQAGELPKITAPTLVCIGEFDPNLASSREIAKTISDARLEVMKNVGHGSVLQRPDLTTEIFLAFVDEQAERKKQSRNWPHPGGNTAHWKYSPLDQIDLANVAELEVVWTWDLPDLALVESHRPLERSQNNTQPIVIDGIAYVTSASSQVAALDAATGEEK